MPLTKIQSLGITDGAIVAADIASGAITAAKLASGVGGKVLQVVTAFKSDSFSTSSGTFTDVTGVSVSITPSSASNKILIFCRFSTMNDTGSRVNAFNLVRNSTAIAQPSSSTFVSSVLIITSDPSVYADFKAVMIHHLDSPSTTSSTTYKLQMRTNDGSTGRVGNRSDGLMSNPSEITVMEIAG